ncbi:GNAT family N-acetyltransferase [Chelativorans sp. Marseille-P2723]|uniref:GNAT family N-acetyltransferase n=1 Tax=Chelativorans sp. Marseille-P2723 TaxID=2709133 RepID=UPI0015713A2F|nr:GNAT family N-acetyltransferase [Chelativorans sp. Marseille-P2723]
MCRPGDAGVKADLDAVRKWTATVAWDGKLLIRAARREDIVSLVAIFAADALGGHGDTTDAAAAAEYEAAFEAISACACSKLYVAEIDGRVVGTFQTMLTRSLPGRGALRMIIEAVQTCPEMRGRGIGEAMMRFAIERAKEAGARQVQLMSNESRLDAHRFYQRLGFTKSHLGFKMRLE